MNKIIGIYKITNTVTGDFYIGSSKDVKQRWSNHKKHSTWKNHPNNQMYLDMKKYGTDKFEFQVIVEVEIEELKEREQYFIETLKPSYNNYNAKGWDIERQKKHKKEYNKEYNKTEKGKKYQKEYHKEYEKTEKRKKYKKEYESQLCRYNGETLTLGALRKRFMRQGIDHPIHQAKKYLIKD